MRITEHIAMIGSGQMRLSSAWDCHVYALLGAGGVVLIDAGSGLGDDQIISRLATTFPEKKVVAILLTHAHADHAAGAASLSRHYDCPIYAGSETAEILEQADEMRSGLAPARAVGRYPEDLKLTPTRILHTLVHDGVFRISSLNFHAIAVRGHSEDSLCYETEVDGRRCLFAGDVVFYGGILGVINTPDSGMQGYTADLPRLASRKIDALFPSHGMFTLEDGQRHIDHGIASCARGFLPSQVGQREEIF